MRLKRPPGPTDALFGLSQVGEMRRDLLSYITTLHETYGDMVYLRLGHLHEYLVFHPDLARQVLVEKASSFIRYERQIDVFRKVHGESVLVTEGDVWQRQRRLLLPAFGPKSFPAYVQQMSQSVSTILDDLSDHPDRPVDVEHAMNMVTMGSIMRTMFGSISDGENAAAEYAISELGKIGYEEMFRPASLPDWLPLPGKRHKRRCIEVLDKIIWRCIAERRRTGVASADLLGQLLRADDAEGNGGKLSDQEIRDQCMTIFLAGYDTTAAGLTWAAWCLASHPDVAAKAYEEVDRALGSRIPDYNDLPNLPYVSQVIKETLRLYPPAVGTFLRRATETVEVGSWTIPKGSLVAVMSFVIQRDARWHPNPLQFDPDRFSPERSKSIPRGAYMPFGTGPRVCLGNNFAMTEMTLIVAMLLQRFKLATVPASEVAKLNLTVTLRPAHGMPLMLQRRGLRAKSQSAPATNDDRMPVCPFHRQ